jgi:8-oxo-dGTP pyrophosphatase MutT (NUDIX family)
VVEAALGGRVHLPHYRGRSCHPFPAQAAERAVREETGLLALPDVSVRLIGRTEDGWRATVAAGGTEYEVDVRREEGEPTHLTCSTAVLRRPRRYVTGTPRVAGSPRARAS